MPPDSAEQTIQRLLRLAQAADLSGIDRGISYGTPSLTLKGRFLARVKDEATLVIRCPLEEKPVLIEAEPAFYFETPHYQGWPAILVRLEAIDDARLMARLERAWLMQAGVRAIAARRR